MLYEKSLDTLIYNGTPHGKTARRLRDADAGFYAGLGPLADELAEDILLAGGTAAAAFTTSGQPMTAAAAAIHARAVQRADEALAGFVPPEGGKPAPGVTADTRAEGLARLFLRSASGIARFYEAVLPELSAQAGTLCTADGGESFALGLRPDFAIRMLEDRAKEAGIVREITQPHYDSLIMGGSLEQYEERAMQLAACRLDRRHVPPKSVAQHLRRAAALG